MRHYLIKDFEAFRFLAREFERWGEEEWGKVIFTRTELTNLVAILRSAKVLARGIAQAAIPILHQCSDAVELLNRASTEEEMRRPESACAFLSLRLERAQSTIQFCELEPLEVARYLVAAGTLELTVGDVHEQAARRLRTEFGVSYAAGPIIVRERSPEPRWSMK